MGQRVAVSVLGMLLAAISLAAMAAAQAVTTTTVQGTVYLANGQLGAGTLVISWPAFTTAAGQAVAAESTTVKLGPDGFVSVNLAPNVGATPAGEYYTAVYYMSDGTTSTQYWVVPAAAQASLAQVQSQVMPAAQAVQAVSKAYVDQAIAGVSGGSGLSATGGTLTGPLYLNGDPTQPLQAADKHYVDTQTAAKLPLTGGSVTGTLTAKQLGALYQVDQFPGADIGAKIQACVNAVSASYGGTCDARNFTGNLTMGSSLTISTSNTAILLPCATITTANQIVVTAGTRNVALRGCALRGGTSASGSTGGTAFAYTGSSAMVEVGDPTYATDTPGFHLDNVVINTTGATSATAQGLIAFRTQEMDLESLYFLGNSNQTGMTLDGTGNYTGGTYLDNQFGGFGTAVNAIGHQVTNPATTDWMNASTFVRLHINCPTSGGNPIAGTYGINLLQGDGNTFTGGDVEGCSTALHLGSNAQNNTIVGLRNENSTSQVVADAGSAYNSWMTGGTMFTGKLTDNGTRNSFLDTFHRSFNALNGDWYMSQQDATLTNHFRLGTGLGNERGLLNEIQTDYGYRWIYGFSDATGGQQLYQVQDLLNNVYRLQIQQWNQGQSSTNNQTALNAAGTGNVCFNCSTNSGTGGVTFASGGATPVAVATVDKAGNGQFVGNLLVGGTTQSAGTMSLRNSADAEVDYYLWPGLTTSQKGSFTYKDWNGNSQWYLVKDASNNWELNSATGGLDSFKAYQSTNSGDTYIDTSNPTGHIRLNFENGAGAETDIYSGSSTNLDAAFVAPNAIKFPGLAAASGDACLEIDNSGYITNTGSPCGTGSGSGGTSGTINSGNSGQIAYYMGNGTSIGGMSAVPLTSGGTGSTSANGALANLGGLSAATTTAQTFASPLTGLSVSASVNSQIDVMAPPYNAKGDCVTDDQTAINAALRAADAYAVGLATPAVVYFPKPPGGCYLTSNLTWYGEPLEGQASGMQTANTGLSGVVIKGMPGEDILAPGDPTTTNYKFYGNFNISHLTFTVNDTGNPSFPHRWPGRWFDDGAMTANSTTFKTTYGSITAGDAGQAIQVNGAGPGGTNLVTTIASVTPAWALPLYRQPNPWLIVTLAAAASTTVTNAHTYISVDNLPVTATVGNCAIALDNKDANTADWVNTNPYSISGEYARLDDVEFNASSGINYGRNNSCGLFAQGQWGLYGADFPWVVFSQLSFGNVQAGAELNSYDGTFGDFEKWNHLSINAVEYPWITYDEGFTDLESTQITSNYGLQILTLQTVSEGAPTSWTFNIPEMEGGAGGVWTHITGNDHKGTIANITEGASQSGYLDTNNFECTNCGLGLGTNYINGASNKYNIGVSGAFGQSYIDGGRNNQIHLGAVSSFNGIPDSQIRALVPEKGTGISGQQNADFLVAGDAATPWTNNSDLLFWPQDAIVSATNPYTSYVVPDSSSLSGNDFVFSSGQTFLYWSQFETYPATLDEYGYAVIGTNVPATQVTLYFTAKCASSTTFNFNLIAQNGGGNTTVGSLSGASCTTSFANYSLMADLSASATKWLAFNNPSGATYDVQWIGIRPFQRDYNGQQPVLSSTPIGTTGGGPAVPTGPTTSTSGDLVTYTGISGQEQDSGVLLSSLTAKAGTNSCTSGQYETGDTTGGPTCAQVAYTQISGAPSGTPPSGAAGGDLGGNYPNPTVTKLNGGAVPASSNLLATNSSGQPAAATAHNESVPRTCSTTNSANAYSCATAPSFAPAAGDTISIDFNAANTGSATLAVNGAAATTVKKWGNSSNVTANDVLAGHWISATYDGTYWQLEGQLGNANATQINGGAVPASALAMGTNSSGQPISAATTGSGSVVLATSPTLSGTTLAGATTMQGNVTHINGANASQTIAIQPGSSADYAGIMQFNNYSGTAKWQVQKDANNYLRVTDAANSLDRVILPANANTTINAGAGANAVVINNTSGSGTGGLIVYEGGSNYSTAALQVSGSGNTTATGYLQGKFVMGTGSMGVAPGAAAGSSPTIACTTNHTCDGISGTVTLTTGTSPTTGTLATLSFPNTHSNQANCMVTTLSATAMITSNTWTESTTAITITANAALTASTAYTIKYWCGGY